MAEDLEVGVLLEPQNDLEEDVGPVTVGTEQEDGGGLTPAQQDEQESAIAGGVSRGILAAGIFAGILSQLKTVTGIIQAVFGIVSRSLIPVIEKIADFIRPLASEINRLAASPQEAQRVIQRQGRATELGQILGPQGLLITSGLQTANQLDIGDQNQQNTIDEITDFLFDPSRTADQTGEQSKQQLKDKSEDAKNDVLGGFF